MISQFIEAKVVAMSLALKISAMDSLALMTTTASVAAADISSLSPSEDACPSQKMSSAHDSSNPHIDLPFHPSYRP